MREKLRIAKQLNISRKNFSSKVEDRKLFSKVYRAYILECIIKGKNNFKLSFKGTHLMPLGRRIKTWCGYYIYRRDIYFKPVYPKITNTPNEFILELFLKENGFEIVDEHLDTVTTIYIIARI